MASFSIIESLYTTKTSTVYRAVHTASQAQVALKCYCKKNMVKLQKIQAMREIWFHSRLTHPHIISMHAAWIEGDRICLAIEYAPIGSAFRKLRRVGHLPENIVAKFVVHKVLCALLFLHELNLIHRDIKPENILLTNDGCKLADLGLVINQRDEVANTCLGTFDYMVRSYEHFAQYICVNSQVPAIGQQAEHLHYRAMQMHKARGQAAAIT